MPAQVDVPASVVCPACDRNVLVREDGRLWLHAPVAQRTTERCRLGGTDVRDLPDGS